MSWKKTFNTSILFLFLFFCLLVVAQPETNYWHFGGKAGLNFNSGAAIAFTNSELSSPITTGEGCSSISDASGNLLFYTNGVNVWNRNNIIMPNGAGLFGHASATQSCIIVPKPGNANIYYIFTNGADGVNALRNGLHYSEVDITLNGGLGDVTVKNVMLLPTNSTTEKLAAIKHCNGKDYWVLTHEAGNNKFDAYLVTASGVNNTPVVSSVGSVNTTNDKLGYMKFSANGKMIAAAIFGKHVELFDFDDMLGVVSNARVLNAPGATLNSYYGVEFSPDCSKLYATTFGSAIAALGPAQLFQFNLSAGATAAAINASATLINSGSQFKGALQLASNGRIYLCRQQLATALAAINNPNNLGAACGYVANAVGLAGKTCGLGLPNFVQSFFYTPPPRIPTSFTYLDTCLNSLTKFSIVDTSDIDSVKWSFNDPSSLNDTSTALFPAYIFSSSGNYAVQVIIYYKCFSDTILQSLNILPLPNVFAGNDTTVCNTPIMLNAQPAVANSYLWLPSAGLACNTCASTLAIPLATTQYKLYITDTNSCIGVDSITVTVDCPEVIITGASVCKGACYTIMANASGGVLPYTYAWSPTMAVSTFSNTVCPTVSTVYSVTLTDANGSTSVDTALVTVSPDVNINLAVNNNTCFGDASGSVTANVLGGILPYTYQWNTGMTAANTISNLISGNYHITITDANGCSAHAAAIVTEPPRLTVSISGKGLICKGNATILTAAAVGGVSPYIYSWLPGSVNTATVSVSPSTLTTYTVTVIDGNGCSADTSFEIVINELPQINYTLSDSEGCALVCVTFNNYSNSVNCVWDFGDGSFSTSDNVVKCYSTSGNYNISLTVTDANGCSSSKINTSLIKVYPMPLAAFMASTNNTTILSPTINFTNLSQNAIAYSWDFGDGSSSTLSATKVQHTYEDTATYTAMLIAYNEFGCTDTAHQKIYIRTEYTFYTPNAFTPNGDGRNETFMPYTSYNEIESFTMYIFNRWGSLIFETSDIEKGWDGKANGGSDIAQEDVYVWKMNVQLKTGEKHRYVGHVSLIK